MGAVDGEHVDFSFGQFLGAFEEVAGGADGRAYPQASLGILGGVGIFELLLNVL